MLAFLCCLGLGLGSFGTVGDMEFTAANIYIFRIAEHHPPYLQSQCKNGVVWYCAPSSPLENEVLILGRD